MTEPPINTPRQCERSKALRIALTAFIVCYVCVYAVSFVWSISYSGSKYWVIESGAFGIAESVIVEPDSIWAERSRGEKPSSWEIKRSSYARSRVFWPYYFNDEIDYGLRVMNVFIPLWLPLLPLLILAAVVIYRDRTRRPPGHCRKCGYDLKGNTTGRCPECGTPDPEWLEANARKS